MANNLIENQQVTLPLPDGETVLGNVKEAITNLAGNTVKVVSLENGKGGLELTVDATGTIDEMVLFDKEHTKFYRANIDENGTGALLEEDANSHICLTYPMPLATGVEESVSEAVLWAPDITVLQNLESRPGAPNVIYLDFWGVRLQVLSGIKNGIVEKISSIHRIR